MTPPPPPLGREAFARRWRAGISFDELDPAFAAWIREGRRLRGYAIGVAWAAIALGAAIAAALWQAIRGS